MEQEKGPQGTIPTDNKALLNLVNIVTQNDAAYRQHIPLDQLIPLLQTQILKTINQKEIWQTSGDPKEEAKTGDR